MFKAIPQGHYRIMRPMFCKKQLYCYSNKTTKDKNNFTVFDQLVKDATVQNVHSTVVAFHSHSMLSLVPTLRILERGKDRISAWKVHHKHLTIQSKVPYLTESEILTITNDFIYSKWLQEISLAKKQQNGLKIGSLLYEFYPMTICKF